MEEKNLGGRPKEFRKRQLVSFCIDADVWDELKSVAARKDISAAALVRGYVWKGLLNEKKR